MYTTRIQIANYGPIERLDITFPFDGERPKPLVLVGPNGSGKSIVLSHIVNGLLAAQQRAYPQSPEVESGKVYKLRSPQYIAPGKKFSFARVDFKEKLWTAELQLDKRKQDYEKPPEGVIDTDVRALWKRMADTDTSHIHSGGFDNKFQVEGLFTRNCILFLPPDRFEDPAWLNEANLHSKASHMDLRHMEGHTERKIINYSPLSDNQNWLFGLAYDFSVFERQSVLLPVVVDRQSKGTVNVPVSIDIPGHARRLYDTVLSIVRQVIAREDDVRLGIGPRHNRTVSLVSGDRTLVPNIFQLSGGEVSLLNLFLSILRDYDLTGNQFTQAENVSGIVVVDEIDLHLNVRHQREILPQLIKMFPKIQFIVTSHSPLFVLGPKQAHNQMANGRFPAIKLEA